MPIHRRLLPTVPVQVYEYREEEGAVGTRGLHLGREEESAVSLSWRPEPGGIGISPRDTKTDSTPVFLPADLGLGARQHPEAKNICPARVVVVHPRLRQQSKLPFRKKQSKRCVQWDAPAWTLGFIRTTDT